MAYISRIDINAGADDNVHLVVAGCVGVNNDVQRRRDNLPALGHVARAQQAPAAFAQAIAGIIPAVAQIPALLNQVMAQAGAAAAPQPVAQVVGVMAQQQQPPPPPQLNNPRALAQHFMGQAQVQGNLAAIQQAQQAQAQQQQQQQQQLAAVAPLF